MPFRRNRNRFRRRRVFRRRGGSSMWNLAKKAASSMVKYYLNPEYKFHDTQPSMSGTNTGTILPDLSYIAQGDTLSQRNGNSIKITSILMRFAIVHGASTVGSATRVILFTDVSSAGAVPTVANVLETTNPQSPMNKLNGSRFKVLREWLVVTNPDKPRVNLEYYKKMNHHIKFLDTTATATSLGQGPIYLLVVSNEGVNFTSLTGHIRLRYLDN